MAKKRAKAAKKKSAKKAPPRPRPPARKNQEPSAVRREQQTEMAAGDVDLAEVLRREGISEGRIPEAISLLRGMSDAQSGEATPPSEPIQPPEDSVGELSVATAADAILAEVERGRVRARRAIAAGRSDQLRGHRETLWAMEPRVLRGPPRFSYVGRAIHVQSVGRKEGARYLDIFETINAANPALLPESVRMALPIALTGSPATEPTEKRKQEKTATSSLLRNLDGRVDFLINRIHYATSERDTHGTLYKLTRLGIRVFNGWPNWRSADAVEPSADAADPPEGDGAA
jgi:hypothetical protein